MTRARNVWDAVWGQIELSEEEWELINTPAFQRLRRIHQLALTMLVFPGATHTRFEHGLGTSHVAHRIADRLIDLVDRGEKSAPFNAHDARLVRLSALLHDVGHGPFSHVVDPFLNRDGAGGHEWVGAMAVERLPELRDVLERGGQGSAQAVADLLVGRGRRSVSRDIVSGPADADKIDYLRRDSHYTGVTQGLFDHEYFIDQLVGIESVGETWLGFRWNAVWAVEGLKLARYHMHSTVYGHRNRIVTDLMLERGLRAALGKTLPADLLTIPSEADFDPWFQQYQRYDDWNVFSACVDSDGEAGRIFRRLRDHQLLKVLVFLEGEVFKRMLGSEYARLLAARTDRGFERACEAALAATLGFASEDVIVHIIDTGHVLDRAQDPLSLDEDINFVTPTGEVEPFADRSEIFSSQPSDRWRRQLLVYAPVGRREAPELADKAEREVLDLIRSKLADGRDG